MTQSNEARGLPAWTYVDADFFALELERLFAPSWQIVCHVSDLPENGSYATLSFLGALVLVVRGDDGAVRAFRNVCRHRAARLLDESFGFCRSRIVCPYHAWTYDLQGQLIGVPGQDGYRDFDKNKYGLMPLELGECGGFYFVRFGEGGSSFEEFVAPLRTEFEIYRTAEMRALGRVTTRERSVNWKIAVENYVDKLHLPVAHAGLYGLLGDTYTLKLEQGICRIEARVQALPNQSVSARAYQKFLPEAEHLPERRRRTWLYLKLWPNLAFDIYPDQIDFMQFIPLAPNRTVLREIAYARPDSRREMRAARYLNWRINRVVNAQDKNLIERVQVGLADGTYQPGPISRDEVCLRDFAQRMRQAIPQCREERRPPREQLLAARKRQRNDLHGGRGAASRRGRCDP